MAEDEYSYRIDLIFDRDRSNICFRFPVRNGYLQLSKKNYLRNFFPFSSTFPNIRFRSVRIRSSLATCRNDCNWGRNNFNVLLEYFCHEKHPDYLRGGFSSIYEDKFEYVF